MAGPQVGGIGDQTRSAIWGEANGDVFLVNGKMREGEEIQAVLFI